MKNKIPQTRENTMTFISTALSLTTKQKDIAIIAKAVKPISELLIASFDDSIESVRNATAQSLAQLASLVQPKTAKVFLDKLDKIKLAKVEELIKTDEKEGPSSSSTSQPENTKQPFKGSTTTSAALPSYLKSVTNSRQVFGKPKLAKPIAKNLKKKPAAETKPKVSKETKQEITEDTVLNIIDQEQALEQISGFVPENIVSKLSSPKWQERKEAVEELNSFVMSQGDSFTKESCNIIFRQIEKSPSFKDIPQVIGAIYSLISTMASTCKQFCKGATVLIIPCKF